MDSPAYYSNDQEAIEERGKCDYDVKISTQMAATGTAPRKIRIYADGIWDVFHQGHAEALRQAKTCFPKSQIHLIVAVPSDRLTHANKGCTVFTDRERAEILRHCRYVDEVMLDAPWTFSDEFITSNKIDFIAHDEAPYVMGAEKGSDDLYADLKAKDMFVATCRTEGISTSDVIARVLINHDEFVRRNLQRGNNLVQLGVNLKG